MMLLYYAINSARNTILITETCRRDEVLAREQEDIVHKKN